MLPQPAALEADLQTRAGFPRNGVGYVPVYNIVEGRQSTARDGCAKRNKSRKGKNVRKYYGGIRPRQTPRAGDALH